MTVATYVIGAVLREAKEIGSDRDLEKAEAILTQEEIEAERERYRSRFVASGRYPRVRRMMEADTDPDAPETRDERFGFGLDCVLGGVAVRLQAVVRGSGPAVG